MRRRTLGPEDKQVRDWFRKSLRSRWAGGPCRHTLGIDVRLGAGAATHVETAEIEVRLASSTPSRPAANMTACSARWPRSKWCAPSMMPGSKPEMPICICNWTNEEGSRFAPAMMALGGLRRRLHHRRYPVAEGCRRRHGRRGARQHRLSRREPGRHPGNFPALSNCISSRVRSWKRRTRPSAWSIPARACCGTTARSPVLKAMPARRRCRCAATRWRPCRKSCWRWRPLPGSTARRRSAPSAKP